MSSRLYGGSPITSSQQTLDMHDTQGGVFVETTSAITGEFSKIEALEDTVIATMISAAPGMITNAAKTSATINAVNLPAGSSIRGRITHFQLTSGSVIAYHAP